METIWCGQIGQQLLEMIRTANDMDFTESDLGAQEGKPPRRRDAEHLFYPLRVGGEDYGDFSFFLFLVRHFLSACFFSNFISLSQTTLDGKEKGP
mgnify:CR=1 FL=1